MHVNVISLECCQRRSSQLLTVRQRRESERVWRRERERGRIREQSAQPFASRCRLVGIGR